VVYFQFLRVSFNVYFLQKFCLWQLVWVWNTFVFFGYFRFLLCSIIPSFGITPRFCFNWKETNFKHRSFTEQQVAFPVSCIICRIDRKVAWSVGDPCWPQLCKRSIFVRYSQQHRITCHTEMPKCNDNLSMHVCVFFGILPAKQWNINRKSWWCLPSRRHTVHTLTRS